MKPKPAPATPAATSMAEKRAGLFIARNELERLSNLAHTGHSYLAKQYCDQCKAAVNGIAAINTALQSAAQPQRESEQPEQALREALKDCLDELDTWHISYDKRSETDGSVVYSPAETKGRAALSPQTDSQEPR